MKIKRTWSAEYKHERRKHRHRCFCCSRILTEGEPAILGRIGHGTRALHDECADKMAGCEGDRERVTYGELLGIHSRMERN